MWADSFKNFEQIVVGFCIQFALWKLTETIIIIRISIIGRFSPVLKPHWKQEKYAQMYKTKAYYLSGPSATFLTLFYTPHG
jgi:hypothetical protein